MSETMRNGIRCLTALLCLPVLAAEVYVGDGANDNTYSDNIAYAQATKIVKTGTGRTTLSFGSATSSFAGEIEVREGTLAVAQYPGNFGSPTKITVSAGATLDLSWTGNAVGNLNKAEIVIAGTGVNGAGAICRTSGSAVNSLLGTVTLAGDALIKHTMQIGFNVSASSGAVCNLNGHTLTVNPDTSVFYCPNVKFLDNGAGTHGGVTILSGTFFPRYNTLSGGTSDNTLTLSAGATLRFRELSAKPEWTIKATGTVTFEADSYSSNDKPDISNVWAGPTILGGQLTLAPKASKTFFTVTGGISGNHTMAIGSGNAGTSKLTGTNEVFKLVSRSGTLLFGGGKTSVSEGLEETGGNVVISNATVHFNAAGTKALNVGSASNRPTLSVRKGGTLQGNNLGAMGASARIYLGRNAGECGRMVVEDGATVTNAAIVPGAAGRGAFYQTGGSVYWPLYGSSYDSPAVAADSYAYYGLGGGTFTMDASGTTANYGAYLARTGMVAVAVRNGAFLDVKASEKIVFGVCTGARVSCLVSGGSTVSLDNTMIWGHSALREEAPNVQMAIDGEGTELLIAGGMIVQCTNAAAYASLCVNNGGVLNTPYLYRARDTFPWYLNLNGGVIKPRRAYAQFTNEDADYRKPTRTTVYEGGFTIDTSLTMNGDRTEYGVANMQLSFEAPGEGRRVAAVALPADPGFAAETVFGPPLVTISGDGAGAAAFALYDDVGRAVTNIVVTSPGWGYTTATAMLSGGGMAGTYTCAVTLADQPTSGWKGFTKRGAQRLNLMHANTFKGDVTVEEGILGFQDDTAAQGGLPAGAGLILKEGSILTFLRAATPVTVPFISGCGSTSYGHITVTNRIECSAAEIFAGKHLTIGRTLTLADGVKVVVTDPENLAQYRDSGAVTVLEAGTAMAGAGPSVVCGGAVGFDFGAECTTDSPARWILSVKANAITLKAAKGTKVIFR